MQMSPLFHHDGELKNGISFCLFDKFYSDNEIKIKTEGHQCQDWFEGFGANVMHQNLQLRYTWMGPSMLEYSMMDCMFSRYIYPANGR